MPIKIANDARPQVRTLLVAVALSVLLWFIPFAEVLTYPFRLFVTFIHEGGHALAGDSDGQLRTQPQRASQRQRRSNFDAGRISLEHHRFERGLSRRNAFRSVAARRRAPLRLPRASC
jgi:hypothetical protein